MKTERTSYEIMHDAKTETDEFYRVRSAMTDARNAVFGNSDVAISTVAAIDAWLTDNANMKIK